MSTDFIILENGSVIRKSCVHMVHTAYDADEGLYRVEIHHSGGVITSYYYSEEDAENELKRLTSQLLEEGE